MKNSNDTIENRTRDLPTCSAVPQPTALPRAPNIQIYIYILYIYRMFNLKVDHQLSREYFTSDAIYNSSAGMTLYCYMCRSWQDCCRRGENRSWPSVSVESVDSECWCLNNAIFYALIMRLTVEERVFILESYLKTMSYANRRQSFFEKFIGAIRDT